jgi:hypothetical protein
MKSKKILLALALLINVLSFGQTNTFPTTGNVGIGITNPRYKLDIFTPSNDTESYSGIYLQSDYFGYIIEGGIKQKYGAILKFTLKAGGTISEKLRIDQNGNVGIGTTDPTARLEVAGNTKINGNLSFSNYGGGFFMQDNDWIRTFGNKNFYHNTGIMRTDGVFHVGSNGNRLVVNELGNVGIGITNPGAKLDIFTPATGTESYSGINLQSDYTGYLIEGGIKQKAGAILKFSLKAGGTISEKLRIDQNGKVGIGTTNPDQKLTVKGKIHAEEIIVDLNFPADYVFQKYYTGTSALKSDYVMPTLAEIENFTKKNHHLPNVPSAAAIQQNGLSLGEMSNVLLQKIEELTLYAIEQDKKVAQQQQELDRLKTENENYKSLAERLSVLEKELKK